MDPLDGLSRQLDRLPAAADGAAAGRVEAAEAVPDPEDLIRGHAVVREGEDDVLDDVVEAWVWVLEKRREEREVSFFSPNEKRNQKRFFPFSTPKLSSLFFASFSPSNNSPGQRPPQVTMAAVVVAGSA